MHKGTFVVCAAGFQGRLLWICAYDARCVPLPPCPGRALRVCASCTAKAGFETCSASREVVCRTAKLACRSALTGLEANLQLQRWCWPFCPPSSLHVYMSLRLSLVSLFTDSLARFLSHKHTHTRARARAHTHTHGFSVYLCLCPALSVSVSSRVSRLASPRFAPPSALLHTGCSLRKSFQRRSRESNRNCETECRGFEGRLPQSVACYSREDHEGGVTFAFLTPTPGYAGAPAGLSILSLSLAPFCAPNPSAWCHAATQVIDHETKEDLQVVPIGMLAYCTQGQKDPNVCVCPEPSLPSLVVTGLR